MYYFDIYDLDRPRIINDFGKDYERVCRVCGAPMFNKDGKYSVHRRYCQNHNGYELWVKYNWGEVSKKYAWKVAEDNKELIERLNDTNHTSITICEVCSKLCLVYDLYWDKKEKKIDVINIHHKFPVHKITMKNIHLIWDYSNLIALCKDCHNKQDHYLKRPKKVEERLYKEITSFF